MITVMGDAGHGGVIGTKKSDPGAIGTSGRYEKDFNLYVVLKLSEIFKNHPEINFITTRSTDIFLELADRTKLANKSKVDAFISFHANSFKSDSTGTETHYTTPQSKRLAEVIQKYQLIATGLKDRGLKVGNLYVTKNTNMPACLLEPAYISNPKEDALIFDPVFMDNYAMQIALGICEYFGVDINAKPIPPAPEVPKNAKYVPLILGDRTFDGFILDGKSYIPAKEVMTALNFSSWSFKVKSIYVNDTQLETIIFKGTSYIKATDLKAQGILLNVMFDPDSTNAKRVLLFPKEVSQ